MILLSLFLTLAHAGPDRCAEIRGHQRQLATHGVVSAELDAMLRTCTGQPAAAPVQATAKIHSSPKRQVAPAGAIPVSGVLTSRYGWRKFPLNPSKNQFHKGVDIGAPKGTPVLAAGAGVVIAAGRNGGHGKSVRIRHPDGVETVYSHLSSYSVRVGDRLQRGERLGRIGSTGVSTGPHLHYGVFVQGQPVDPLTHALFAPQLEAR